MRKMRVKAMERQGHIGPQATRTFQSAAPPLRDANLPRGRSIDVRRAVASPNFLQLRAIRTLDVVVAVVAMILCVVPALIISAIVAVSSSGPVLFRQQRVGQHGKGFKVLKFRTMRNGTDVEVRNDAELHEAYKANDFKLAPDDPRITAIGRLLRKTSLDELPQLLNVLRGQMSIVGIRPLLADELAMRPAYDQDLYRSKRPGMTGLWQVEGRSSLRDLDRYELDRRYVEEWSVWNDIKIIIRTPLALLKIGHAH